MTSTTPRSLRRLALGALTGLALAAAPSAALAVAPWHVEKTLTNADAPGGSLDPYLVVPNPKGDVVYVTTAGTGAVPRIWKLDANTNAITGSISLPSFSGNSFFISVDPAGDYLYANVDRWNAGPVYKIDLATETSVGTVARPTGKNLKYMGFDPSGTSLYTLSWRWPNITKTDLASNTMTTIPLTGDRQNAPGAMAFSPDGRYAYVTYNNVSGSGGGKAGVVKIDLANPSSQTDWVLDSSNNVEAASIAISPDGATLYRWNEDFADLYVMDSSTGAILHTIDAGASCNRSAGTRGCGWGENTQLALSPTGGYALAVAPAAPALPRAWMIDLTSRTSTPLTAAEGFSSSVNPNPDVVAFGVSTTCNAKFYVDNRGGGVPAQVDIGRAVAGPCAPTGVVATPGVEKIDVSFTAPDNGGSPITGYEYSLDGGATWKSTGSTDTRFTISGLKGGTAYTVTVRAINAAAPGAVSAQATATPTAPAQNQQTPSEASPAITMPAASVTRGATLTTAVNPSVAGTVRVTATLRGRTVCTATRKATRAGRMMVTCTLRPAAQAAIRKKAVTLRVTTRLTDAAGKTATASRNVRVARYVVRVPVTG